MRSRSSRLFVVLLHLVGVSTNFPRNPFLAALHPDNLRSGVGIIGVHPLSILLEPLELQAAGGLGELLSLLESAGYDVEKTVLGEPYWLQDDTDGKCLGPDGFSECGDATLWKIRRRPVINASLTESSKRQLQLKQQRHKGKATSIQYHSPSSRFLAIFGWDTTTPSSLEDDGDDSSLLESSSTTTSNENENETLWEYALELVDVSSSSPFRVVNNDQENENTNHQVDLAGGRDHHHDLHSSPGDGECVLSFAATGETQSGSLEMGPCSSVEAWSWSINEGGVLKWDEKKENTRDASGIQNGMGKIILGGPMARFIQLVESDDEYDDENQSSSLSSTQCLWRFDETSARTEPCDASSATDTTNTNSQETAKRRLVGLSVIQYQNSAAVSPKLPRFSDPNTLHNIKRGEGSSTSSQPQQTESNQNNEESHLPHTKRSSTRQSTTDTHHHQPKAPVGVGGYSERPQLKPSSGRNSSPEIKQQQQQQQSFNKLSPMGVGGYFAPAQMESSKVGKAKTNLLHRSPSPSSNTQPHSQQDTPHRPRKIPVHPYIAASKEGLYEDINTGLLFPTDIHSYLGHERKESGRHTLAGVGLFTKTMLKIKVYSVALYLAKRDVLADSNFAPYANMDVEELRENDGFYETLMDGGTVDKTLFIQLNMQLATQTVRQSLSAEWKLLSNDHKEQLASSSARPRVAEERMLETIKKEENTSNCSCGQTAPPEYEADITCCARGTEMVFTWRKNGNCELRIDGRLMDVFTDPIIGKGIFFEYLRGDDPMSPDAREHFADGFPFLLAPLAQVKGVSSSIPSQQDKTSGSKKTRGKKSAFAKIGKLTDDIVDNMFSRANDATSWVQGNLNGGVTNVGNAINALSKSTQNLGSDIERRREQLMSQLSPEQIMNSISTIPGQSGRFFMSRLSFLRKRPEVKDEAVEKKDSDIRSKSMKRKRDIFRHHLAKMLDESSTKRPLSDEIAVIIEPIMSSTHMLFLYMVHFYLVLLLIVSVPDLHTNRLVIRRSSVSTVDSDSDHEERLTELDEIPCDISCWDQIHVGKSDKVPTYVVNANNLEQENGYTMEECRTSKLKKSLSYYL